MLPLLEHEAPPESPTAHRGQSDTPSASRSSGLQTVFPLIQFNLKLASKRGKLRQTVGQIVSNILIIGVMRLASPDGYLPATKYMNVFDPIRECTPGGASVSFFCDEAAYGNCEVAYEKFVTALVPARIDQTRYTDELEYRASLKYGGDVFGAHLVSPTQFEVDVPPGLSALVEPVELGDGKQCRMLADPSCAPVQLLRSCAAAVEYAALSATRDSAPSPVKFRIFPQKAGGVNGITDSFLVWLIPLYLSGVLLNLYNFALIEVVSENEGRHRDYLIGWGVSRLAHFFAWLASNLVFGLLGIALMVYGLVRFAVFSSDFSVHLFIGFFAYFVSLLSLAYVLSLRIKSTRTASNVASFTDLVFNITSLSAAAIHNRVVSLLLAAVPTVPFFLLLRAIAYDQGRTGNPFISSSVALLISVTSGLLFAALAVAACIRDTALARGRAVSLIDQRSINEVVHLQGVTKRYAGTETDALRCISMSVKRGEIHTLIGGNGAGKTTLINALLGIHSVDSADSFSVPPPHQLALCLQEDAIWEDLTVRAHIEFFTSLAGGVDQELLARYVERLSLTAVMDQDCLTLSGGQKRRFSFLLAMVKASRADTDLIILDEPTTGVDVDGRRLMWEFVKAAVQDGRKAVLLTTHYLDEAQALSDRVTFLTEGEVRASGTVMELQSTLNGGWFISVPANARSEELAGQLAAQVPMAETMLQADKSCKVKIPAGRDEDLLKATQICESFSDNVVVESVSLDNLFMAINASAEHDGVAAHTAERMPASPKWIEQTIAMARIRILPKLTNFSSFFSYIVFPSLLICFSLFSRQLRIFGSSQSIPDVTAHTRIDAVSLTTAFNISDSRPLRVPVVGDWRWQPLPAPFEAVRITSHDDMFDFLGDADEWFPFAVDAVENLVYVNPTNPRSLIALLSFFIGEDSAVSLSIGSFLSDPQFNAIVKATVTNVIMYAVLSLSVLTTQCATQIFDERRSFIKRLAQIQGMHPSAYWTGSVLGHFCLNFPVILAAPLTAVFSLKGLISDVPNSWLMLAASAVTTTVQLILFGYLFVFLFRSKEQMLKINSLATVVFFEFLVIGVCTLIVTFYRSQWPVIVFVASLLIPPLNIAAVISELTALHMNSCSVVTESCHFDHSVWSAGVWVPILAGIVQIAFLATILVAMERKDMHRRSKPCFDDCSWAIDPSHAPHPSVQAETDRVMQSCDDDVLFVKLWHHYPSADQVGWAVKDLTLGVKRNEVLGLLGRNGAGKTTALADLLAIQKQTAGYAGLWPGKRVGFCPQSNPLWDGLSGLEHVRFYASLRGCWTGNAFGEQLLASVGIEAKDMRKRAGTYSGGMKRRLCLAIAIVEAPDVLILDEPTAGVDVAGKRDIWAILKRLTDISCSVLITTHSLEEADNLCSRISIMDAGRLVRVGTTSELKQSQQKLVVSVEPAISTDLFEDIRTRLGASPEHVTMINETRLEVDTAVVSTSWVVDTMIQLKRLRSIRNYSLAQLSLEEVFLGTVGPDTERI